ncbi:MAG TPA: FliA/WhiG family RNA polymerase sigma factor [Armatimonadota bacterium]|nr:FliA/WhiG family RNA polymerase sigma factor [Armatimonadota bacterium]
MMVELWTAYREAPSDALRRQLIEQYAPLARYVVDRLNLQPSGGLCYDDLISQAIVGLIEAIDRYDPSRGVKFNTYAYYRIRGAVMDMLRELDWVPRSLRAKSADIINTIARLEGELGRAPSDAEIAAAMGLTMAAFDELAQEVGGQTIVSLDETVEQFGGDAGMAIGELIPDQQTTSPEEHTTHEDLRRALAEAIEQLPENERLVISLYYHDGLTLKEIGKVLGVTESRVCQLHAKAILRLRAMMQTAYPDF